MSSGAGQGGIRRLASERGEIRWILTRKKVKNVNLRVKPDGIVRVSAGTEISIGFIEDFIREKTDFIFSALEGFAKRSEAPGLPKSGNVYQSGDTLRYFGKNYTLRIEINPDILYAAEETVSAGENEILVTVRYWDRAGKLLEKFYAEKTRELFETLNKRTALMFRAKGYGTETAALQIREMSSQWGSCHISGGKIVMNSRLALYPEICSAYVFVHEYAHFVVPNHSREFYKVVGDIMPDYKVCKRILTGG